MRKFIPQDETIHARKISGTYACFNMVLLQCCIFTNCFFIRWSWVMMRIYFMLNFVMFLPGRLCMARICFSNPSKNMNIGYFQHLNMWTFLIKFHYPWTNVDCTHITAKSRICTAIFILNWPCKLIATVI